jgi:peptide/nickel transport system substrate-binding protein
MREVLRGQGVQLKSPIPAGTPGSNFKYWHYDTDYKKAKELLAKAGLANGFTVTMDAQNASPFTDIAQAIQSTWGQAGIRLEIQPADLKQVLTKFRARNHDIVLVRWGPDYQDPHTNAETFAVNEDNSDNARSKTLAWRNSWDIPAMTKETLAAVTERDTEKRAAIYEAIQREHQKVSPFIIMFQEIEEAAHRKTADGFVLGPSFDNNLYGKLVKR